MPEPTWPFNLDDPVRAVHYAIEPDCPYSDPVNCPREATVLKTIRAYQVWIAAHPQANQS